MFRFARIALASILVALAAFGHVYGKSRHDHGQAGLSLAWTGTVQPNAEIAAASISNPTKLSPPSASLPTGGANDETGCGCCFSGCGCCSTALWRHSDGFTPPPTIFSEPLFTPQHALLSGLRPDSLFRPPRLTT
ncbi:hypothetical protein GGD83_004770 [Rhodoblastus sphagnicola]|uniref:hypothetical protein n=1 Tax=Rhodoblastus sphagnicola TaxID=333368 RepID=UPI0011B0378F|nr:hypothetical protein [Rhodoblastus sphagnicola]MBB4200941.1 hypothetical protein [Rhodoblastus sphagnicola]